MDVLNPLPVWLVALTLLLPCIWLAGRALARAAVADRVLQTVLAPGAGAAVWLLLIHGIGRAARSFTVGLTAGTIVLALFGLLSLIGQRPQGALPSSTKRRLRWMVAGAIVATAMIAPFALRFPHHDEIYILGHMSIASQIQNDIYPPRHMMFPEFELRYHYGFDTLAAVASALARLRVDQAIDAVTIAAFAYTWCLLWTLGERVIHARGRGTLVAFVTLFGGGISFVCSADSFPPSVASYITLCNVDGVWANPPTSSYFFQHPFSIGFPLATAAILVSLEGSRRPLRYVVLGLLLAALSLSQVVLFLSVSGAIAVQEALSGGGASQSRFSVGRSIAILATLGATFLIATRLGGFFVRQPELGQTALILRWGITDSIEGSFQWLLITYGAALPLGILGLFFLRRGRPLFGVLLAGCFAILFSVRNAHSWDIVKFATVAFLALSVLTSATLDRLLSMWRGVASRVVFIVCVACLTVLGVAFPVVLGFNIKGVPPGLWDKKPEPLGPSDVQAASWIRQRIAPGDIVYRSKPKTFGYAIWGGLPQPWPEPSPEIWGVSPRRIAARRRLLSDLPDSVDAFLAQRIRWLALDRADRRLGMLADGWIEGGRAREAARFGGTRVIELLDPSNAAPAP
jgi:hypothetical protein